MGSLVINHNTAAINTHRNLLNVDKRMKTSLEHLSSGEKIVRAADGPAALMISEQMRAQVASIRQAIDNAETSVSMVQTTEASLDEVNRLLVSVRQLAIHAANEGANDENMLAADQFEVSNALESIDRISRFAQFGTKKLLDGSRGVNGVAAGMGLTFLEATPETRSSPEEGYEVRITQGATKSQVIGQKAITPALLNRRDENGNHVPITLTMQESGRVAKYTTTEHDDVNTVVRNLQRAVENAGLRVTVDKTDADQLRITHEDYGSDAKFVVVSSEAGVLSTEEGKPEAVQNGRDVMGTINNQFATGDGRELTAAEGTKAEGLKVLYEGGTPENTDIPVGRVNVTNNALVFQIGPNAGQKAAVSLDSVSTRTLGTNVLNESGFKALTDVDVRSAQGAADTMRLVDKAIDDINVVRAKLGALQKNSLESNLRSLRVSQEELTSAESVIRDADMAQELSEYTRNQIFLQSGMAMLGQANQSARNVLSLLQQA